MKLDDFLSGKQSVQISGHVRPDGDCVGSVLGVYNYIREYFPQIRTAAYLESVPDTFRFLKNADEIRTAPADPDACDLFIALDCGDKQRLGDFAGLYDQAKETLCIDHHMSNREFAEHNFVDPKASSACELVFRLLDADKISRDVAECLYTGIVTDTGVFQYSSTSSETMRVGGVLMDKGINYPDIVDRVFYRKTFGQLKAEGFAFTGAKKIFGGKAIYAVFAAEDMRRLGLSGEDLEGIVSELRSVDGVEASVFLHETPEGSWKLSMRSASYADVAAVAMKFGGGGHVRAAGATLEGSRDEVLSAVLDELEKII